MDLSNLLRFVNCQRPLPGFSTMFLSKFSVPVTRYISLNLQKLLVHSANRGSCSDDIKRSCIPEKKIGDRNILSRFDDYKAAVANCLKRSCKTDFEIPPQKCNSKISDTYLESLKSIEDYAKKIAKLIEKSTDISLQDLEISIQQKITQESSKRQEFLKSVEAKIWELISLDSISGIRKKWEILMINDKVAHELKFWDKPPDVEFLRLEIQKFKNETKNQADIAIALIKSCRKCYSPFSLKDCVEKKTVSALEILDKTNENASRKIAGIRNLKARTLRDFGKALEDITESYRKEIVKASKQISQCIDFLKKQGSVRRNYT